jgi:NADPH:quinone reductase-like Zn-dependent oxidoreductase
MKLRYKILSAGLTLVAVSVFASMLALSHTSPCPGAPALLAGAATMKAAVHRCYGPPDIIALEDVARPMPADYEVLVKVRAASVNPLDWHVLSGEPYIMRVGALGMPNNVWLGADFAGTVEAVGGKVTRFRAGDEVFGSASPNWGAFAEYVTVFQRALVLKPANLTFEEAAALPVAASTALQALRDQGHVRAGQKVLINGASGGVGTFAVQLARELGAEVTAVCSTKNVEMVRALGANHVVDYTKDDVTRSDERYDVIIDNVATRSLLEFRRVMQPQGHLVIVGAGGPGKWIGPFVSPLKAMLVSPFVSQEGAMFIASIRQDDLSFLADLAQSGKLKPVIDRRYSLHDVRDAMRYIETGHARAKVIITVP